MFLANEQQNAAIAAFVVFAGLFFPVADAAALPVVQMTVVPEGNAGADSRGCAGGR